MAPNYDSTLSGGYMSPFGSYRTPEQDQQAQQAEEQRKQQEAQQRQMEVQQRASQQFESDNQMRVDQLSQMHASQQADLFDKQNQPVIQSLSNYHSSLQFANDNQPQIEQLSNKRNQLEADAFARDNAPIIDNFATKRGLQDAPATISEPVAQAMTQLQTLPSWAQGDNASTLQRVAALSSPQGQAIRNSGITASDEEIQRAAGFPLEQVKAALQSGNLANLGTEVTPQNPLGASGTDIGSPRLPSGVVSDLTRPLVPEGVNPLHQIPGIGDVSAELSSGLTTPIGMGFVAGAPAATLGGTLASIPLTAGGQQAENAGVPVLNVPIPGVGSVGVGPAGVGGFLGQVKGGGIAERAFMGAAAKGLAESARAGLASEASQPATWEDVVRTVRGSLDKQEDLVLANRGGQASENAARVQTAEQAYQETLARTGDRSEALRAGQAVRRGSMSRPEQVIMDMPDNQWEMLQQRVDEHDFGHGATADHEKFRVRSVLDTLRSGEIRLDSNGTPINIQPNEIESVRKVLGDDFAGIVKQAIAERQVAADIGSSNRLFMQNPSPLDVQDTGIGPAPISQKPVLQPGMAEWERRNFPQGNQGTEPFPKGKGQYPPPSTPDVFMEDPSAMPSEAGRPYAKPLPRESGPPGSPTYEPSNFPQGNLDQPPFKPTTRVRHIFDKALDLLKVPQTLQQAFDFSAHMSQLNKISWRNPGTALKALQADFEATASPAKFNEISDAMFTDPTPIRVIPKGGGMAYDTTLGDLVKKEVLKVHFGLDEGKDIFPSKIAQKLGAEPFERGFTAAGNVARFDVAKRLVLDSLERGGGKIAEERLNNIANLVQRLSGRGELGQSWFASTLKHLGWAPGLRISGPEAFLQMLNVSDPYIAKQAAEHMVTWFGGNMAMTGLMSQIPGMSVGTDPFSSEFGKVRKGNSSYNLFGSDQVLMRTIAQMVGTSSIESGPLGLPTPHITGETHPRPTVLPDGTTVQTSHDTNLLSSLAGYLRSGADPVVGTGIDLAVGKNIVGDPIGLHGAGLKNLLLNRLPLIANDVRDIWKNDSPYQAAASAPYLLFGGRATSYSQQPRDTLSAMPTYDGLSIESEKAARQFNKDVQEPYQLAKQRADQAGQQMMTLADFTRWYGQQTGRPKLGDAAAAILRGDVPYNVNRIQYALANVDSLDDKTLAFSMPISVARKYLTQDQLRRYVAGSQN